MAVSRYDRCWQLVLIAALCGCVAMAPGQGRAQSLSEKLTRTIGEAQKAEVARNFERALSVYDEALRIDPAAPDLRQVLRMRARLLERLEEYQQAEKDWTDALNVEPPDLSLYVDRGYFYIRRGRYRDAMADFTTGARLDPNNSAFSFGIGRVHAALGHHTLAIESYDRALDLDSRNARALLARAESNVHLGQLGKARDDYAGALALPIERPQDRFFALLGRGYVALMLGDFAAAVTDFDGALAIDPGSQQALAWRGFAYEKQGRRDFALNDYERAAAADPARTVMRTNVRRLRANEPPSAR